MVPVYGVFLKEKLFYSALIVPLKLTNMDQVSQGVMAYKIGNIFYFCVVI
jgi:hypothetical protein